MLEEIKKLIANDFRGPVGLRGLYEDEGVGELRPSRHWDDGEPTDELMGGTCVILISGYWADDVDGEDLAAKITKAVDAASRYSSGRIGLVVGSSLSLDDPCADLGEGVIVDAECIAILK